MPQIHLRAEPDDYAPLVLPGDPTAPPGSPRSSTAAPARRLVNSNRGLLGYTGPITAFR